MTDILGDYKCSYCNESPVEEKTDLCDNCEHLALATTGLFYEQMMIEIEQRGSSA